MSESDRLPTTPEPMYRWSGGDGLTIAGDCWGTRSDPPVLLLHGGGQTRHAWRDTGKRVAERGYCAIAYDARGHGDSDWAPDGAYGDMAMVADLVRVLSSVSHRRPVLVGASMGGSTALSAIGSGQVDAAALVLVDVAPRVEPEGVARIQRFMRQRPDGFSSLEEVAEAISNYQPHRVPPPSLTGLAKNVRLGGDGRYYWHWDPRFQSSQEGLTDRLRRLEGLARNVRVPTLLIRGAISDVVSDEGVEHFLSLCPHAEYANVAGAAHMVAGDRNDRFTKAIIDFLTRLGPRA